MSFNWLQVCAAGQTDGCVQPVQLAYLALLVIGIVALVLLARRSRDLSTSTIALMPVAIAINVAVGSLIVALRLPIYLDSIGTVLVGVLAGPWAGAITGLLANLIWSILPVPGGAGPTIAFFAPVAAVIGLMAGFWGSRGVFQLRSEDARVGSFLALALGAAFAVFGFVVAQATIGINQADDAAKVTFVTVCLIILLLGVAVAFVSRRTVFAFRPGDPRITAYLSVATGLSAGVLLFAILRLLLGPSGWFSGLTGASDSALPGVNLSGLALADPVGFVVVAAIGVVAGFGAWTWISKGDRARLFPVWVGGLTTGLVAAAISAPIAAGVFGGVTGGGTDALVALYRTLGLNIFQSAFAQGLTSDPLDKTISYTVVFFILAALPVTVRTLFSRGETTVVE